MPAVLTVAAGLVFASFAATGGLLAHADLTARASLGAPRPKPSTVDSSPAALVRPYQALGIAPPPRLLSGTGPYGAIVNSGTPAVALTFDDGPDPTWTPRILALLRQASVKATFCLVGLNAVQFPALVRAIAADGHTLCNHSWSHNFALGRTGPAAIRDDLTRTNAAIRAAVPGARIVYFRQPGGFWTPDVVAVARQLGMASLHWTVDPRDWSRPPAPIIASTVSRCPAGAVVLLHDGGGNRANTADALGRLLPGLTRAHPLAALPTGGD